MLAIGMSGSIAICAVAITANPNLVQDLVYPPDSYGNSCGKGLASEMKKAMYPRLDHDMSEQWSTVASGLWWNFKPTVVCAPECPDGMSLANPTIYGGPSYPCNGTAACGVCKDSCRRCAFAARAAHPRGRVIAEPASVWR